MCSSALDHQFKYKDDAENAVSELNQLWFNGRRIHAELSLVTDFREACCRQYQMGWASKWIYDVHNHLWRMLKLIKWCRHMLSIKVVWVLKWRRRQIEQMSNWTRSEIEVFIDMGWVLQWGWHWSGVGHEMRWVLKWVVYDTGLGLKRSWY